MRHYRRRKVGAAIAIARLPRRLQHAAALFDAICGACATNRFPALLGNAARAKAAPSITSSAKPKLNAAPTANDDAKALRTHRARNADYWTWASGRDEGAVLRRTGDPEGSRVGAPGPSLILAVALPSPPAPIRPSYLPVNGERRPAPPGALHRLCADRGARSQRRDPVALWRDRRATAGSAEVHAGSRCSDRRSASRPANGSACRSCPRVRFRRKRCRSRLLEAPRLNPC